MNEPVHPRSRIALLVDYDNAQIAASKEEFRHCRASALWAKPLVMAVEKSCGGAVDVRRAYGNTLHNVTGVLREREWNPRNLRERMSLDVDMQMDLSSHGFQVIHCPTVNERKNRADILMVLDCMEIATTYPHIDTFAILSHDSDFSPLIQRLRAIGKRVALITVGRISDQRLRSLAALASIRVSYDQSAVDAAGPAALIQLLEELNGASDGILESGLPFQGLQARFREKVGDFFSNDLGFSRFGEFVEACIEPPLIVVDGHLFRSQRPPKNSSTNPSLAPKLAVANGPAQPKPTAARASRDGEEAQPVATPSRSGELRAALNRQQLRVFPELMQKIVECIQAKVLPAVTGSTQTITYGELQQRILEWVITPAGPNPSKTQISDVLKVLNMGGALKLESDAGLPLRDARVVGCCWDDQGRESVCAFVIRRLESNGIILSEKDVPELAKVVFSPPEPAKEIVQNAFRRTRNQAEASLAAERE